MAPGGLSGPLHSAFLHRPLRPVALVLAPCVCAASWASPAPCSRLDDGLPSANSSGHRMTALVHGQTDRSRSPPCPWRNCDAGRHLASLRGFSPECHACSRPRLCENSAGVALSERATRQIASGSIFSTSPEGRGPPKLRLRGVFPQSRPKPVQVFCRTPQGPVLATADIRPRNLTVCNQS